ncbi:MAG: hypothetical protein V1846_04630 [Candidatus Komeilibacteria bacterium]
MKYKLLIALLWVFFLLVPNLTPAAAENLPDLQVLSITIARNSQAERIGNVVIINAGRAATGPRFNLMSEWLDSNGQVINTCDSGAAVEPLGIARVTTAVARACPPEFAERAVKLRVTIDKDESDDPLATNLVHESNESNNSKTVTIPLPDLKISSLTLARNSQGERIGNVIIVNTGRGSTPSFFNLVSEWLDSNGRVINTCGSGAAVESLGFGEISTAVARACPAEFAEQAVKLRVIVDRSENPDEPESSNLVHESNESNNSKTVSIPLPDLRITSIVLARNERGERIGNVNFINAGRFSTSPRFNLVSEWLESNGRVINTCGSGAGVEPLGVARTSTAVARACPPEFAEQAVKLRVTLDMSEDPNEPLASNLVHESNESNNSKTVTIPLSDLRITSISLARNERGERIGNVNFINSGRADTAPRFNLVSEWLDSNNRVINTCGSGAGVASLGVGRTSTAVARACPAEFAEQAVKLRVTLDMSEDPNEPLASNLVHESNESNNSKTIDLPAPDLKIEGMNFRGSDLHPEVTIINKGTEGTSRNSRVAYDWYNIFGERLGGCYETMGTLGRNKRYTQKDVFCGNNDSYKYATKFKATVDVGDGTGDAPQSQIRESNENNNSLASPIPGRVKFIQEHPPVSYIFDNNTGSNNPSVDVPGGVLNPVPDITIPVIPQVDVPVVTPPTIIVPEPEPVVTPPVTPPVTPVNPVVTPEPTTPTGDRYPSITVTETNDGLATYTVSGHMDYWGTYPGCTGPRYFDPIIVAWGQVDTHPALDSGNNFTSTHKYDVKNSSYNLSVSFINSCFQRTTKRFTVYPKL